MGEHRLRALAVTLAFNKINARKLRELHSLPDLRRLRALRGMRWAPYTSLMGPRTRSAIMIGSSFLSGAAYAFSPALGVELRRVQARDPRQDAARLASDFARLTGDARVAVARVTADLERGES